MLKSEMQHQYWLTKKTVQRKLGAKEDECIISSDAELDAKIELFKSIADSCKHLYRIIDQYQERLCILAHEENSLGKFLKESGKNSKSCGKVMTSTGKAISYSGQQRMSLRGPLVRLHHEVEIFRIRAISDTQATIMAMEKERTEYRAALSWMKSASGQLDPDAGKGLEKFRKSQNHVRLAKAKFDRLALDCLEKIDLLAAARCNMFSHALVTYMDTLLQFSQKSSETFLNTASGLTSNLHYNFCILKDLAEEQKPTETAYGKTNSEAIDNDQLLFFMDDYEDKKNENADQDDKNKNSSNIEEKSKNPENLIDICSWSDNKNITTSTKNNLNILDKEISKESINLIDTSNDLTDFYSESSKPLSYMPSQLLLNQEGNILNIKNNLLKTQENTNSDKEMNSILNILDNKSFNKNDISSANENKNLSKINNKDKGKDMSAWFQLFSELDPLSNPDTLAQKIDGRANNSQTA